MYEPICLHICKYIYMSKQFSEQQLVNMMKQAGIITLHKIHVRLLLLIYD